MISDYIIYIIGILNVFAIWYNDVFIKTLMTFVSILTYMLLLNYKEELKKAVTK